MFPEKLVSVLYENWEVIRKKVLLGKCGRREHLVWPASEFSLPKLENNIASK